MRTLLPDGLSLVEDLLDAQVSACKPPHVPVPKPGPCPKAKTIIGEVAHIARKTATPRKATAGKPAARYSGPPATLSAADQAKVDEYLAAHGAYWGADYTQPGFKARETRYDKAKAALSPTLLSRAEHQQYINNEFRNFKDGYQLKGTDEQVQAKMADTVRKAWAGKPIAIRATASELASVLDDGRYKTQHEMGRSTKLNSEGKPFSSYAPAQKAAFEQEVWGIPAGTTDWRRRPVYGFVAVNGLDDPDKDHRLAVYGPIQIVLKPEVRERTTAIMGDSWNDRTIARPSPVNAPTWESYSSRLKPFGGKAVWKWDTSGKDFRDTWYAEAQIHGGVTVQDIAELTLPEPPDDTLRAKLAQAAIPWRIAPKANDHKSHPRSPER